MFGRPFPSREELLQRLESYQRDLEQELANLDDVIRHLRDAGSAPAAPGPAEA
jgi:exonuclease VII small subunit